MSTQPEHYASFKIQPMDAADDWDLNFGLGSSVKYIARHKRKGTPVEDLEKARNFIDREIQRLKAARMVTLWECYFCKHTVKSRTHPDKCVCENGGVWTSIGHIEEQTTEAPTARLRCNNCRETTFLRKDLVRDINLCPKCHMKMMVSEVKSTDEPATPAPQPKVETSKPKLLTCNRCDIDQFGHIGDTCLKCNRPGLIESPRPKEWKGQSLIWVCERCNWICPLSNLTTPTKCPECKGEKFIHPEFEPATTTKDAPPKCFNCGKNVASKIPGVCGSCGSIMSFRVYKCYKCDVTTKCSPSTPTQHLCRTCGEKLFEIV